MKMAGSSKNPKGILEYVEEENIGDVDLRTKIISGQLVAFLWVEELDVTIRHPRICVESESEKYFLYGESSFVNITGLVGLSLATLLAILSGEAALNDRIFLTNVHVTDGKSYSRLRKHGVQKSERAGSIARNERCIEDILSRIKERSLTDWELLLIEKVLERSLTDEEKAYLSSTRSAFNKSDLSLAEFEGHQMEVLIKRDKLSREVKYAFAKHSSCAESLDELMIFPAKKFKPLGTLKSAFRKGLKSQRDIVIETADKFVPHDFLTTGLEHSLAKRYGELIWNIAKREQIVLANEEASFYMFDGSNDVANGQVDKNSQADDRELCSELGSNQDMIELAREVRKVFWEEYDENVPDTIPNAQEIVDWLISEKDIPSAHKARNIEIVARNGRSKPSGRPKKELNS